MDLKLISEDSEILRKVAEPWAFDKDGSPEELIKEMTRLMFIHGGIGLAAPQCGVSKRIFIMGNQENLVACINPEIIYNFPTETDLVRDQEGCLSFPDLWLYVERYRTVKVRYYNVAGEKIERELSDLMARVFQHENQHLEGICFDTQVGSLALSRAKEKRKKIKKVR